MLETVGLDDQFKMLANGAAEKVPSTKNIEKQMFEILMTDFLIVKITKIINKCHQHQVISLSRASVDATSAGHLMH